MATPLLAAISLLLIPMVSTFTLELLPTSLLSPVTLLSLVSTLEPLVS